jgi:hypothetical protein
MDIQRILIEYAKLHLNNVILQEQIAALQEQVKLLTPKVVATEPAQ